MTTEIQSNEVKFCCSTKLSGRSLWKDLVFLGKNDDEIRVGDWVEFYKDGDVYPTCGTISYDNGVQIDCFDLLGYKWNRYPVKVNNFPKK